MAKAKKEVKKAVAQALKKDDKIGTNEVRALIADYGYKGVQASAKALESKNKYEISEGASQVSGLKEKQGGVFFTPSRSTLLPLIGSDYGWIKGDIPQQPNTRAPGNGWVATNLQSSTNPTYRFVGKGYDNLRTGGGGGGNGGGGNGNRADRDSGKFSDIMASLEEDRMAAKDWQQGLLEQFGLNAEYQNSNLSQQIADSAIQQQNGLNSLMIQQEQAYQQQLALQRQQMEAANAAYAEQQRQATQLARAYVPDLNPVAYSPLMGDMRTTANSSTLSGLAILSGGSSLSGLQIA